MSDHYNKQDKVLAEKIDELESLIRDRAISTHGNPDNIKGGVPILDELITEDDLSEHKHQLDLLADRLERKFFSELDEIVAILKTTLKKDIRDELQDQLEKTQDGKPDT